MLQDLGRHVERRTAQGLRQRRRLQVPGKSEIRNLELELIRWEVGQSPMLFGIRTALGVVDFVQGQGAREQQILRLDVAMDQLLSPQKLEARCQVAGEPPRESLREPSGLPRADEPLHVAPAAVLQDEVEVPLGLLHVVHADDVGVAVCSQDGNFDLQILEDLFGELLGRPCDGLDGHRVRSVVIRIRLLLLLRLLLLRLRDPDALVHGGEGSGTQLLLQRVALHHLRPDVAGRMLLWLHVGAHGRLSVCMSVCARR
mmetsp:Transcript_19654/g.55539  ORF Transcript_19654/g.55539 Transcript_19654/m.55539 type:complete len:257 (+) Transcript_19654:2663-3433(+)